MTEFSPLRYETLCKQVIDAEIDSLAREVYNGYDANGLPEDKIFNLLSEYLETKGYTKTPDRCINYFFKEGCYNTIVVRSCQNYMFDVPVSTKFMSMFEHPEEHDINEYVCHGDFPERENGWVYYLWINNFPKDEIIKLLKVAKEYIKNTPKDQLGEIQDL